MSVGRLRQISRLFDEPSSSLRAALNRVDRGLKRRGLPNPLAGLEPFRSVFRARGRRVAVGQTRAHVEYRNVAPEQLRSLAEAIEQEARHLDRLTWVQVNADTQRVLFAFESGAYGPEALCQVLEAAEAEVEATGGFSQTREHYPADLDETARRLVEALADAAGLTLGLTLRLSPLPTLPFSGNGVALLALLRGVPQLRRKLEARLGQERAHVVLNLLSSLSLGVAQRPLSSLVELLYKAALFQEVRLQREVWLRREGELCRPPDALLTGGARPQSRPLPLPKGPLEAYADRAVFVSLGGFALSFLTTRSFQRAAAALFGGLPRPARLGREMFSAALSNALGARGVVVLNRAALRRLDRIDCLVLHGDLVSRRHFVLGALRSDDAEQMGELRSRASVLFNPKRPLETATEGLWQLLPWGLSSASVSVDLRDHAASRLAGGALLLSLERAARVVAIVEVEVMALTGVEELISAAHAAEMRVVIAEASDEALADLNADEVLPSGESLESGLRRLQLDGYGVCLVGDAGASDFAAADCGIGLCRPDRPTPWAADLVVGDDLSDVEFLIAACAAARRLSKRCVNIALGAATLGAVTSAGGLLPLTHRRVMFVVNMATLAAFATAQRSAASLTRRAAPAPRDPTPWHALDARGVRVRMGCGESGLSREQVARRASAQSSGLARPLTGLGDAITDELFNPLAPLLAAGAALSVLVGSLSDGVVLGGVAGLNAVLGGGQRFLTERRIGRLAHSAPGRVRVRRGGAELSIREDELVVGDLVLLAAEDTVPADCRVVESEALEVDASSLTGESLPVGKSEPASFEVPVADRTNMIYAGTTIASGRAVAVVVPAGSDTAARLGFAVGGASRAAGGVEQRLRALMELTSPVAAVACLGVVLGGLVRGRKLGDLVGSGVSLAVASVPEGLPVLATAAQLASAGRLARKQAWVRNPRSIEALGRVNVICVDKTGTLTRGQLELSEVDAGDGRRSVVALESAERLTVAAALRATSHRGGRALAPSDEALRRAAARLLISPEASCEGFQPVGEVEFTSRRKFHATLATRTTGGWLSVKGAPEVVLGRCTQQPDGSPMSALQADRWLARAHSMADRGLRVLAIAERSVPELQSVSPDTVEALRLNGLVGFSDPVRPSARAAVAGIGAAGVSTVMITGDHVSTARSVAAEVGLLGVRGILTGADLASMSDDDLDSKVARTAVFARVTPAQKVRVLRSFQRTGRVVAMMGDGTNDAPAIRLADCGIAVGEHATAAARAAADVLLVDGRIETLVEGVIEGRAMWASVRDAVSVLVGGNFGEIAFALGVGLLEGRTPLNARQLLLVNLLTDVAPATAIAIRPPSRQTQRELAQLSPEQTLGEPLDRAIALRAMATAIGAGSAWTVARLTGGEARARTVALAALVGSQLGQTLRFGGLSRPVLVTSVLSAGALIGVIQTPGLSHFFGCRPLGPLAWGTALSSSLLATSVSTVTDRLAERLSQLARSRLPSSSSERPTGSSWAERPTDLHEMLEPLGELGDSLLPQ